MTKDEAIKHMRLTLSQAANQFRIYAEQNQARCSLDGEAKAQENLDWASKCDAAAELAVEP